MLIKVTRTSAGCILGRFALGAPRLTAEQVGTSQHPELLNSCPSVLNSCPPILLSTCSSTTTIFSRTTTTSTTISSITTTVSIK